jgi:hypothetical protein
MSIPVNFIKATFTIVEGDSGPPSGDAISVHFNPTSLQHAVTNTMKDPGHGNSNKQYVGQSTAKLTMDLIFDTTDSGQDVRLSTTKIAQLMKPTREVSSNNRDRKVPPVVLFEWGNYKFQGMVESFKETIDFFSGNGVPLRASVNLTMSEQDHVFDDPSAADSADTNASFQPDAIEVPTPRNQDATQTAAQGGDPSAGRSIAAANNLDSMRFTGGASLTLNAGAQLKGAAGFSAGASAGAGGGFGLSGGAGLTAGAGASASFGGSASAGISASGGAFEGLRASSASQASGLLNTSSFLKTNGSAGISTDSGASFNVGGKATVEGSASLSADVGAKADIRAKIQFD